MTSGPIRGSTRSRRTLTLTLVDPRVLHALAATPTRKTLLARVSARLAAGPLMPGC